MTSTSRVNLLALAAALAGVFALVPDGIAFAQDEGAPRDTTSRDTILEEILVTARKREENLRDVPIAISVFSESALEARGMNDLIDVGKFTPNLTFVSFGNGNSAHAAVFLRGIGQSDHFITVDAPVGLYIDGVYLGRSMGGNMEMANIERVEVLRGPQGTLFGKNTLGGAVNVITKKPSDEEEVKVSMKVGSLQRFDANFYANLGLSDTVSMNATAGIKTRGGVGNYVNLPITARELGEENSTFLRAGFRWEASDQFELLIVGDHSKSTIGSVPIFVEVANLAGSYPQIPGYVDSLAEDPDDSATVSLDTVEAGTESTGVSLTATYEASGSLTFKAIAAYREQSYTSGNDSDRSPLIIAEFPDEGESDQWTGELQVLGSHDWGNYVLGAYYFDEDGRSTLTLRFSPTFSFLAPAFQRQRSTAFFGHVDVNVTDDLTLSGGLRWTDDSKDFFFPRGNFVTPVDKSASWNEITWDVAANFAVSDDLSVYGTVSHGYLAGLFNARTPSFDDASTPVDPQFVDSYELGFKGVFLEALQVNVAVFFADYTDLAVPFTDPGIAGGTFVENAAAATAKGVEFEANWQATDNFSFQATVGYVDTEVTEVQEGAIPGGTTPNIGDRLRVTPEWTVSLAPQYSFDLDNGAAFVARADYSYRSDMYFQPFNNPNELIPSREILDLKVWYESAEGDWKVTLYADNVFDEVYDNVLLDQSGSNGTISHYRNIDRQEFGVQFAKDF